MKIAKDIMTKNPFSLTSSMHIPAAVQVMMAHHISSAPVLDNSGKLIGQISEIELLKCYILVSKKGNTNKVLFDFKNMFSIPTTIKESDPIEIVVKAIMDSASHRALVVNHRAELVGIISPKDILKYLVGDQQKSGTMLNEMVILQDRIQILKDQLQATKGELTNIGGIVEKSPFMFHSVDSTGKIVIANEKLHTELGYEPKELIGKSIYDIYAKAERAAVEETLKRLMSSDQSIKVYTTYFKKNNQALRVEVVTNAILNAKSEFVATSSISRVLDSDSLLRALHGIYDSEE